MKKILPWAKPSLLLFSIFWVSLTVQTTTVSAAFDDVPTTSPYYNGASYLELIGAVNPGENFRPDDAVTRAEFFKILFKVLGVSKPEESPPFTDVPAEAWFAPYATLAAQNDLIEGEVFDGASGIAKGNGLGLLMKAYGLGAPIIPQNVRIDLFADVGVKHPLYSLLAQAINVGIIDYAPDLKFHSNHRLTRGELADLLYRLDTWQTGAAASELDSDFYKSDIFADIWSHILNDFYLPPGYAISQEVLFETAVKAVLASLDDPYSVYFTSAEATEFMSILSGDFEGIGALLTQDENQDVFIAEVFEDTPAEQAGLQQGDQITAVDGVSIEGMLLEEVMGRIKGEAGTEVTVTVKRKGVSHNYELTRALITLDLVKGRVYARDYWLVDIDSFADNIYPEMMETLTALTAEEPDPKGIILDLRGNPGGYVNMGTFVAGLFVPHLTPLVTLDYGGHAETIYNGDTGPYQDVPVYILVDGYTASASEILAQTLKEEANATIIGTQTFGKGTAQELTTYWDGSILKLTIANWLSSQGTSVQGTGVTPDLIVDPESTSAEDPWMDALNEAL
jgi:carboxyl-terminal processing protease